jgi:hypothetical protein
MHSANQPMITDVAIWHKNLDAHGLRHLCVLCRYVEAKLHFKITVF